MYCIERMHASSENEKERETERRREAEREKEGERKRSAEINIRPRAPTAGSGWRLRRKYTFPRKGRNGRSFAL
jgi:hypothetical protein